MQAINAHDTDALLACFTADAVVTDEEQEYHGLAQIRAWREKTDEQYHYTVAVIDVTEGDSAYAYKEMLFVCCICCVFPINFP